MSQAQADLESMSGVVNSAGGLLKGALVGAAIAGGIALVGLGIKSTEMAGNFQDGITSLKTGAGEIQDNLKMVSDGILQMAVTTGTSTQQLTSGMYMIESAGFHGAAGLAVLQAASEGARVGGADLGVVAGGVTTLMHDYASSNYTAVQATNALVVTVASGKTHMQDLSNSLSAVLPLASSLHIPFQQVAGAISTMTNAGMPAQQATQNLANAIRSLNVESGPGTKSLTAIGLSAQQVHSTLVNQGLPEALQMIEDHIGKKWPLSSEQGQQALKAIMGGATGLNVALMIGGSHMKEYQGDISAVAAALQSSSKDVQGWSDVQNNFNFKLSQAKEVVETLGIKIGTALLPIAGKLVDTFSNVAIAVSDGLGKAFTYVGNILKTINLSAFSSAWKDFEGVLQQVGNAFGKLGSAIHPVVGDFDPLANAIRNLAQGALGIITNALRMMTTAFNDIGHATQQGKGPLVEIGNIFKELGPPLQNIVNLLKGQVTQEFKNLGPIVKQVGEWFESSVVPAIKAAEPGFSHLASVILNTVVPAIIQIRGIIVDVVEHGLKIFLPIIEQIIPPLITFAGAIANGLAAALKFLAPIIVDVVKAVGDFAKYFMGILAPVIQQIITTFKTQLAPAISQLMLAFNALKPVLEIIAAVIGGALLIALGLLVGIITGVVKAVAAFVTGLIQAVGGVVQMASGIIQILSGLMMLVVDICTGNLSAVQNDFKSIFSGIISLATGFGNLFMGFFGGLFNAIGALVSGFIDGIIMYFSHLFDTLVGHSIIPDMINGIINWFLQLPGRAMSGINSLISQITGSLGNLGNQALTWAGDMISGFVTGIQNGIGQIGSAVAQIASTISSHLHFSKPDIGPLADADTWMPDFMTMLSDGINSNLSKIKSASFNIAATVSSATSPSSNSSSFAATPGTNYQFPSMNAAPGAPQVIVNPAPIYLDGRVLTNGIMPYVTDAIRYNVGAHNI